MGEIGPAPLKVQGQLSLLLQCLSLEHVGLLLLMCNLKEHVKACDFRKGKNLQEVRKDVLPLWSALLPSQDFRCDLQRAF